MAENIKQRGLNVTVTFDDEKLREIVDDLIINQGLEQVVHCKDCKWYDPPHIEYKDGTRKDYPKEPFVTADIGSTVGGMCMAKKQIYCTAHDRENPDDYEEIVMFRNPDDYCSYGERKTKGGRMIKAEWTNKDTLDLQPTCNQLATDLISRQAAIDAVEKAVFKGVAKSAIESLPPVEPKVHCKDCKWYVQSDGKWQYWVCKIFEKIMRKNDYCIYGERADEDKNE